MKFPPAEGVRTIDHRPGLPRGTLRRLLPAPASAPDQTRLPGLEAVAKSSTSAVHPFVEDMRAFSATNTSKLRAENLRLLREKGAADPEAELAALEKDWRKNQKLLMRRSARGLMGLLLDGRIKTAYEVSDKRVDPKYLTYREEVERNIGYFEHRPCYGYVSFDETMKDAPTEFGNIVLTLKPERYKDRVTCCEFDSFDQLTREAFVEKVFLWEDVVHLALFQKLSGLLEEIPFAYDEAQLFGPEGRPNEAVTLADLAGVELPADARFDVIAEEVEKRAPGVKVTRKVTPLEAIAPAPVLQGEWTRSAGSAAKPELGVTVQKSEVAGWYELGGETFLIKEAPAHQLQAELFGSYLWRAMKLPAPEIKKALIDGRELLAVPKREGASDVTSSWFGTDQNEANLRALLEGSADHRRLLLEAFALDLITSNLDGSANIMRDAAGPFFIDFGGAIHSRPAGGIKKEEHLDFKVDLSRFKEKMREVTGGEHPIFSASAAELRDIVRSLIDRGLLLKIADALEYAGVPAGSELFQRDDLTQRMQARALSMLRLRA